MHCPALGSVLVVFAIFSTLSPVIRAKSRSARSVLNEFIVKERAYRLSCQRHNCTVLPACRNPRGWSIWGSDTGCCGNYQGCCRLASVYCWAHDVLCRCCDYGFFLCGPLCTKEPDCPVEREMGSGEIHVIDSPAKDARTDG